MAKTNKGRKLFATTATAALVASAIVPVASAAQVNDFNSISSYAQEAVQNLVDRGVIQGDAKGNFNPKNSVTRAEAATILVGALDLETTGSINFTDVKAGDWYYDAINAAFNNKIVQGQGAGKFNPKGNLTRSEAAIILVNAFGLEGSGNLSDFSDASSVKSWAKDALEIAVANGVIKGDNGKLNPNANITKQDFAVMFHRTENLEATAVAGSVKAINNTTVEVDFGSKIEDIKDLTFTIDGLKVTNAIVKQTNDNVAVLTTEAQEADKTYAVSVDGKEIGSFKGIAAVIATEIKVETTSVQSKVGQQVTLKATTTPGAAVTFNVQATGNSLNENKKYEVTAGTDGVATYTYTQYGVAGVDNVTVYPTGNPSLLGYAKVYWGASDILTVDSEEKTIDNGANRTYTVTYKDPTSGQPLAGKTLNVTFKENLNDIDTSKTNDTTASIRKIEGLYVTPYQDSAATAGSHREETFTVTTNSVGQATFVVTGKNTTATPIVFADADANSRYGATELQAVAGATKFQGVQSPYTITFDRTADFVAAMSNEYGQQNPIAYKVKVNTDKKDKDGNPIPYAGATIKVAIQQNQDASLSNNTPAQIASSENGSYTTNGVVSVTTNAKGEATVYLKSAVDNTKATPVAWIDLNTAGNTATVGNDKLEDGEPNAVAPTVTFLKSVVVAPGYTLNTPSAGAFINGDTMTWKSSLSNQSSNVSETAGIKNATYTITNTSNSIQTVNPRLVDAAGTAYTGLTVTYAGQTQTQGFTNGSAIRLEPGTTVTIHGNAPGLVNATTTVAEYSTTNDALLKVVAPNQAGKISVSSYVTTVRKTVTQDTRNNNNTYTNDAKEAEYILSALATGIVTGEVIGYEVADKTATANKFELATPAAYYGRVTVQERFTNVVKHYYYDSASTFAAALSGDFSTASTDNALANATAFENLVTVGDEIQTNATTNTVRLFNEDKSIDSKASGNSAVNLGVNYSGTVLTQGVKQVIPTPAKYVSSVVGSTNFSSSQFTIGVSTTTATADVAIDGTDSAEVIKNKVNVALATLTTAATATVEADRVVITALDTTTSITISGSGTPTLFNNLTVNPVTTVSPVRGSYAYNLTSAIDITVGQTVVVNGVTYTAGTVSSGNTFNASGTLAQDLQSLAALITFVDTTVDATSDATTANHTLTLTEEVGKEGQAVVPYVIVIK